VVTHQLQVERRTWKVRQSETDVLPLCYATNFKGKERQKGGNRERRERWKGLKGKKRECEKGKWKEKGRGTKGRRHYMAPHFC